MSRRSSVRVRNNNVRNRRRSLPRPAVQREKLEKNTDMFRFKKAFRRLNMRRFRHHPFYRRMTNSVIKPSSINRR